MSTHFQPLSKAQAEQKVRAFEHQIERSLRAFKPEHFAVEVAHRYRVGLRDMRHMARCPPHFLLHALEANCAYYRPWYFKPLTYDAFAHAINLWHEFEDPYLAFAANDDHALFAISQFFDRTQLNMQRTAWVVPFGRTALLYCDSSSVAHANATFAAHFGLSAQKWFQLCYTLYAAAGVSMRLGVGTGYLSALAERGLDQETVQAFLREVARSPAEIGEAYRARRQSGADAAGTPPHLWSQLVPLLHSHPLLRLEDRILIPFPNLLLRLLGDGLHERIVKAACPAGLQELGDRFEWYVEQMFRYVPGVHELRGAQSLRVPGGKSCDFAVVLADATVLVECKATSLDTDYVTANAVLKSTSVTEIIDGHAQLIETAHRLRSGQYGTIAHTTGRPVYGIVATLGRVPSANSESLLTRAHIELKRKGYDDSMITTALSHRPQVLDVEAIELLVLLLRAASGRIVDLWAEKVASNPTISGDWREFLNRRVSSQSEHCLDLWRKPYDQLVDALLGGSGDDSAAIPVR